MCVCECARVSVRARGAASAVRAPPGAGRRGSPGSGASRTELAGHRGRPRRPAGRCGGQSAGPVGAGGGTHCKCLNLRGRPTGPRWGGGATGAGRGARFPGRLPERRVLCPRGVPGREQVGSRGDRGGLFSSRGRGVGGHLSFSTLYVPSSLFLGFWDWPPPNGPRLVSLWVARFWRGRRTVGPAICPVAGGGPFSRLRALAHGAAGSGSRLCAPSGAENETRRWKLRFKDDRGERVPVRGVLGKESI